MGLKIENRDAAESQNNLFDYPKNPSLEGRKVTSLTNTELALAKRAMQAEISKGFFWHMMLGNLVFIALVCSLAATAVFFGPLPLILILGAGTVTAGIIDIIERREKAAPQSLT